MGDEKKNPRNENGGKKKENLNATFFFPLRERKREKENKSKNFFPFQVYLN